MENTVCSAKGGVFKQSTPMEMIFSVRGMIDALCSNKSVNLSLKIEMKKQYFLWVMKGFEKEVL